jgi:3-oxoacyl-[acyl-carrier-protein] synthase II
LAAPRAAYDNVGFFAGRLDLAVRIGVFGWGIVAPRSPNIDVFSKNLESSESWLSPFNGFGPDNFLVGVPEFRFSDYQEWIGQRFAPRRFQQLKEKMDLPAQFAIGAFIQALGQNPGIESLLTELKEKAHVYVGTGLGSIGTAYTASITLYESQKRWDRFWSEPERNANLHAYLALPAEQQHLQAGVPPLPESVSDDDRDAAQQAWNHYWMARSPELEEYLLELAAIEAGGVEGEVEAGKLHSIREKEKGRAKLQEKWQAPEPPWKVTPNFIWNIHNTPASQISILGKITGLAFAPVAACSTFGVTLRLAMRAIQTGDAKVVVMGATDPPPHPLTVGSFYSARVSSADRQVSIPLTDLRGTHVAGGSVVWILGDMEYMKSKGFKPLGMEPLGVGVSSDADHIITPSTQGPTTAILEALAEAGATADAVGSWDLHATATPGDFSEMTTFRSIFSNAVLVTARKGTFGHGMSAGGGWELTAQYLGQQLGHLFPTPLTEGELNQAIGDLHGAFVFDEALAAPACLGGKLSMGIGGINACVISRPLD